MPFLPFRRPISFPPSGRVLQKEEFVQEGRLRRPRNNGGKRSAGLYFGFLNADLDDA
ncbi:hypothetical protein [Salinibacter altiplanensis]|uniref:hypothetical protein n=1 Tax=Salinibacter altiplanensis TaxID=1803181 RepID=UPI001F26B26B|nr:hypothetical protein [Salinibacter altiplanensis]